MEDYRKGHPMNAMKPTKARTQGEKRRAKKARISLAGGDSAEARATGRDRRHTNQPADDPRKPVLTKRAAECGITDLKEASKPSLGHDLGKCICALATGDEQAKLIDTWETLSACHRNYRMRYIGQTGDPKGASIGMVPDPMETDQSLRVDLRTPDEKAAHAKAAWAEWEGRINMLPAPQLKWAIRGVLQGFMGEATLWADCKPATTGRVAVEALRRLAATS